MVRQILLGHQAKEGEYNVVEVNIIVVVAFLTSRALKYVVLNKTSKSSIIEMYKYDTD